jgi:hypothetical protein
MGTTAVTTTAARQELSHDIDFGTGAPDNLPAAVELLGLPSMR